MSYINALREFWNAVQQASPLTFIWERYDFTGGLFNTVISFLAILIIVKVGQLVFNFIKL